MDSSSSSSMTGSSSMEDTSGGGGGLMGVVGAGVGEVVGARITLMLCLETCSLSISEEGTGALEAATAEAGGVGVREGGGLVVMATVVSLAVAVEAVAVLRERTAVSVAGGVTRVVSVAEVMTVLAGAGGVGAGAAIEGVVGAWAGADHVRGVFLRQAVHVSVFGHARACMLLCAHVKAKYLGPARAPSTALITSGVVPQSRQQSLEDGSASNALPSFNLSGP
jgi:hypothetical protein